MIALLSELMVQNLNLNTALLVFLLLKVSMLEDVVIQMLEDFEHIELKSPPLFRFFLWKRNQDVF
jgi:hypothetical protein